MGLPSAGFAAPPLPAPSVQATCVQLCGTNSSPRYCFCPSEASRFRCRGQTQHLGNNQSAVKCETMWSDLPVQSSSQCGLEKAERASERLGLERHVGVTGRARERREVSGEYEARDKPTAAPAAPPDFIRLRRGLDASAGPAQTPDPTQDGPQTFRNLSSHFHSLEMSKGSQFKKVFLPSVPTHPAVSNLVAIQMIFAALCRRAGSLLAGPVAAGSPALFGSCSCPCGCSSFLAVSFAHRRHLL